MKDDTRIPLTIAGAPYETTAQDALSELVCSWGMRLSSITPHFVMTSYGMAEEYAHGFCEYARDVMLAPPPVGCRR